MVIHVTRRKSYKKISCASALLKVIVIRDAQQNTTEQKQKGEGEKNCFPGLQRNIKLLTFPHLLTVIVI